MLYMETFTINIPQFFSIYTSTMDPMGKWVTTPVANQANDSWDDPASGISG